jgi:hypothetical protein
MPTRMDEILNKKRQQAIIQAGDPWEKIKSHIKKGELIPIISNSFCIEQIFEQFFQEDGAAADKGDPSTYDQLTKVWADDMEYPMEDGYDLARVAQYYQVNIKIEQKQKKEEIDARKPILPYYEFLKSVLLLDHQTEPVYESIVRGLEAQIKETKGTPQETCFSEVAVQLDYPRIPDIKDDPLHLLADLPLNIFVTTSQSDFLERALIAVGKTPKTQLCLWSKKINARPEHKEDPNFIPDNDTPLVYHLFGLEDYPESLVLSESDYMDFLISVVQDTNSLNPIIPDNLLKGLAKSQLILLGYRVQDWDFRVLLKFIQKYERVNRGIVVQLEPGEKANPESLKKYLEEFVDISDFDIEWNKNKVDSYIDALWSAWNKKS